MMTPLLRSGKAIRGAGCQDPHSFAWRASVGTDFSIVRVMSSDSAARRKHRRDRRPCVAPPAPRARCT